MSGTIIHVFKKGMNSTRELCTRAAAVLVPGFHDVEYEEGEPDCSKMPTYTVSHFAKALVSDEDEDKLTAFLEEQGVPDGDPDMTIYNVEFAEIDITEAHFTALKSGELSLNELCSELFSDCEPDWATNGETFGVFEESETRLGDMTVLYNQKF